MKSLKRFASDSTGNIAVVVALSLLPIVTAVGAAVDYSRASSVMSQLQSDTDAAALIACKSPALADTDLRAQAQAALDGYLPNYTVTIDSFAATNNPRSVSMTSHVVYPTMFMKVANIKSMSVSASSSCAAGESFYEIAMVLDTTGSMLNSSGSGSSTKLDALKTAAANFVNTLFANFPAGHLKMSIVPFAAMVKVDPSVFAPAGGAPAAWLDTTGQSSVHWSNLTGAGAAGFTNRLDIYTKLAAANPAWAWAGCLESPPYPWNTKDEAPTTSDYGSYYVPALAADEVGSRKSSGSQDVSSNNDYMDDGTAQGGTCDAFSSSSRTRLGQSCKYVTPKNVRTSEQGPNWQCTSRALTTLTDSPSTLVSEINALTASGSTNIHQGIHWGWRTISPNGVLPGSQPYGSKNLTKVIVLMTDGENQWLTDSSNAVTKSNYSAYGYLYNADGTTANSRLTSADASPGSSSATRKAIDDLTQETCTNARAKNVVIYTVAFSTTTDPIDAQGQTLMKNCAGSADRYFLASNASALNDIFTAIAQGIGKLRITK